MSKYTTEIRYICESASGLKESRGGDSVDNIIQKALPIIFNFNYPIFDENYKNVIETKILKHFYTREIGEETVGLWKLRLNTRLNEIMPYYNKMYKSELLEFNPLYTYNIEKKMNKSLESNRNENENINDTTKTTNNSSMTNNMNNSFNESSNGNTNNNNIDKYSDTPQGGITNVENGTYLTNARIINDSITNSTTTENQSSTNSNVTATDNSSSNYGRIRGTTDGLTSTEDYLENIVGFNGVSGSKLLTEYRETFINIDMMIINELEDLFMCIW